MFLYVYELNYVKNTPAQSKIEFTAHVIKISSQITLCVCGPFRDKIMRMYDVANAGRSGTALWYDTSKVDSLIN